MNQEEEFFNKLMVIFQEEAKEHLKSLSDGLLELEKNLPEADYKEVVEKIFREAHSLKGASRSVNLKSIQEICQTLENVFAILKQKYLHLPKELFDPLYLAIEVTRKGLATKLESSEVANVVDKLTLLTETLKNEVPQAIPTDIVFKQEVVQKTTTSEKSVRISLHKLNQLFQQIEETLMIKLFFKQQLTDLKQISLRLNLEDIKSAKDLLNKLIKNADQNSHFVASMVDTLLEDAKKILMQPISTLFDAIPLMVREIARNLSKDVQVEISGGEIEVDRRVLEEIKDPITHLIRNAIDHGIELPEERVKKNKPPVGTIKITSIEHEGNNVRISIQDDGKGMNAEKIKQKAIQKGVISAKDAEEMSEEEAFKLAFHSDVSTSPIITELSGRGLGLGIVSEKVDKLGGQIQIQSKLDHGTTFTLILPLTLATFRGVLITVGDQEFILPTHNIKRVLRIKLKDLKKIENKDSIVIENQNYAFVRLTDLLGVTKNKQEDPDAYFFVLMVKAAEQTIVFGAEGVHNELEILVKSLGPSCIRVKNFMAATIMEKGNIIPVLNPSDLVKASIKGEVHGATLSRKATKDPSKNLILLVEDSITTRMLLKNILTSAAFEVTTAVDGVEALEILQTQNFALMMTDVEMPRMNGFNLTKKVRSMEKFKNLPIIICTALGSREDREKGIELGANAYIDKNNFNQESLIDIIHKLI